MILVAAATTSMASGVSRIVAGMELQMRGAGERRLFALSLAPALRVLQHDRQALVGGAGGADHARFAHALARPLAHPPGGAEEQRALQFDDDVARVVNLGDAEEAGGAGDNGRRIARQGEADLAATHLDLEFGKPPTVRSTHSTWRPWRTRASATNRSPCRRGLRNRTTAPTSPPPPPGGGPSAARPRESAGVRNDQPW